MMSAVIMMKMTAEEITRPRSTSATPAPPAPPSSPAPTNPVNLDKELYAALLSNCPVKKELALR